MTMEHFEKIENGTVCSPLGFQASGIKAGIKASGNKDMAMIYSDTPAVFAGAYTQNSFAAAPVIYCREISASQDTVRACIINSGNANACTGRQGYTDTLNMASYTADCLDINDNDILVFSTGRIGVPLPMDLIKSGIKAASEALSPDGGLAAAEAIMTTDTVSKSIAVKLNINGKEVTIGGTTKGAGMIAPNMKTAYKEATMLAYITSDAVLQDGLAEKILEKSLKRSFNRITVDGDTSTNDSYIFMANGNAENPEIQAGSLAEEYFQQAFDYVAGELAKMLILDAEGATKFVELAVLGADCDEDAEACAKSIANSLLCKTAWFGGDPNWGRILDAAGYSGARINPGQFSLYYEGVAVVKAGLDAGISEEKMAEILNKDAFRIELDLGVGRSEYVAWTCDISYEYVKINAEYRT